MKKLIFALVILSTFSHCTKFGKNISVEGRLLNPLTGEGIADQEIFISRNQSSSYDGGGKKVKSTRTDANGHFRMDRLGVIEIHVANAGNVTNFYHLGWYNEDGEQLSPSAKMTLKKGKTTRANYHAVPYGQLKINIVNQNCQGALDTLIINAFSSIPEYEFDKFNPSLYLGCYTYFGNSNEVPMGWYKYYGTVKRSGVTTFVSDSVYVQAGGVAVLDFFY